LQGFCDTSVVPSNIDPVQDVNGTGVVQCGANGTTVVQQVANVSTKAGDCWSCCQPMGE